jgi:hypothetical protein
LQAIRRPRVGSIGEVEIARRLCSGDLVGELPVTCGQSAPSSSSASHGSFMAQTQTYFNLLEAFEREGCPVCRLVEDAVGRYIDGVSYEFVGDLELRDRLRNSLGFCNHHAYQWLASSQVLGTAQIYADVLAQINAELGRMTFRRPGMLSSLAARFDQQSTPEPDTRNGSGVIEAKARCPVCDVQDQAEKMIVASLLDWLSDPAFAAAYSPSSGLCVPHLRYGLQGAKQREAFEALRAKAMAGNELLLTQLREIIRKHDYRFQGEPAGDELGASERAVRQVAGARGIR